MRTGQASPAVERSTPTIRPARLALLTAATAMIIAVLSAPGAAMRLVEAKPVSRCDLMVILRGGALERISTGVELHADGACDKVLITGDQTGEDMPRIRAMLRDLDPRDRIAPRTASTSTFGDALLAYEVARNGGFRHLLVVTSPYHTRRVSWVFSRVLAGTGIEFGVLPSQSFYMDYRRWWAGPHGRGVICREYIMLWLYGLASQAIMADATWSLVGGG